MPERGKRKITNSRVFLLPREENTYNHPLSLSFGLSLVSGWLKERRGQSGKQTFLSKLIFFNASEHDYGELYTCVASNKLGHTNASITLFGETEPQAGQQGARWGWGVGAGKGSGKEESQE